MRRLTWDEYFGYITQVVRLRSDDEETKIGCVIVDNFNRLISCGYNGTPRGTDLSKKRPEKYQYIVHSEVNAILTANQKLDGCRLYVYGMLPCSDCAKIICQTGIKEVIIVNSISREGGKNWNVDATNLMFSQCHISVRNITIPTINISTN